MRFTGWHFWQPQGSRTDRAFASRTLARLYQPFSGFAFAAPGELTVEKGPIGSGGRPARHPHLQVCRRHIELRVIVIDTTAQPTQAATLLASRVHFPG